jgi:HD superfamily phosphohydrolase
MILRDPVHGLVAFEGWAERLVMRLLDTPELQRLRRVRQLGLTSLVFPGAEHSRFSHAIGAAHVMLRLQARLAARDLPEGVRLDEDAARDALAAAILHDLGHGPFSHLFEEVVPEARHHEAWTSALLRDTDSAVHRALEAESAGLAGRVADLLQGRHRLGWLPSTVSGTLDVDRCDYLLRDSHMTGVAYGLYDLDWVLQALTLAEAESGWVLAVEGRKGLPPIEGFFLGRHSMFQQVYHHKATRAAECLLRASFIRLAELIREGDAPPSTPAVLQASVLGEEVDPAAYLELDDAMITMGFADWSRARDPLLADFAGRFRHRRLPKTLPLPEKRPDTWEPARARAAAVAEARGLRPDLSVFLDVARSEPFPEDAKKGLWVTLSHQSLRRLGEVSFVLRQLRHQVLVSARLVFPAELRREIEAEVREVLR